ncbi:hypothetical protein GUITHDRAFT_110353 [Guillardia theta CCMP2712]|uniref:DNA methylase adenine-specific domain-containing protein n=2 Tax=Guillardia theta TaxID=55529 RepID=L1J5C9_GUITC|nr:hypothetical protein GUITHDRAFT_110353 [Guillardia theta CCMP2712]EKX43547.1 hypothetical protein GUITHDRAFT_110353 [Guillardia theta CCMP2712]|eukprot:XP_005830527.1 hypothetical protein GUITHDRAFT_110353 [Guillardia theta CCMP2712]
MEHRMSLNHLPPVAEIEWNSLSCFPSATEQGAMTACLNGDVEYAVPELVLGEEVRNSFALSLQILFVSGLAGILLAPSLLSVMEKISNFVIDNDELDSVSVSSITRVDQLRVKELEAGGVEGIGRSKPGDVNEHEHACHHDTMKVLSEWGVIRNSKAVNPYDSVLPTENRLLLLLRCKSRWTHGFGPSVASCWDDDGESSGMTLPEFELRMIVESFGSDGARVKLVGMNDRRGVVLSLSMREQQRDGWDSLLNAHLTSARENELGLLCQAVRRSVLSHSLMYNIAGGSDIMQVLSLSLSEEGFTNIPFLRKLNGIRNDKRAETCLCLVEDAFDEHPSPTMLALVLQGILRTFSNNERKFKTATAMEPEISLLMANVAKIREDAIVLDPFCGSCSLLLAAGIILRGRCQLYGYDADGEIMGMLEKISSDFAHHSIAPPTIRRAGIETLGQDSDFRRLKFNAIITDPPYDMNAQILESEDKRSRKKKWREVEGQADSGQRVPMLIRCLLDIAHQRLTRLEMQ